MMNIKMAKDTMMKGKEVQIFRGSLTELTLRSNCALAHSVEDLPAFLVQDGAVVIRNENTIRLYAVEGHVERHFPVYICW